MSERLHRVGTLVLTTLLGLTVGSAYGPGPGTTVSAQGSCEEDECEELFGWGVCEPNTGQKTACDTTGEFSCVTKACC